jgi:hypothetical protein
MGFADDVLKKIFGSTKDDRFLIEEGIIKRDAAFKTAYEAWKDEHAEEAMEDFRRNLSLSKKGLHDQLGTIWLTMKHAQGFRVYTEALGEAEQDRFLLEYIKDLLQLQSYRVSNSYVKNEEVQGTLYREEWYYLKPPIHIASEGEPMNQGFGNIKIEWSQGKKRYIKLLTTTYSGRMYKAPIPFEQLLHHLFGAFSS